MSSNSSFPKNEISIIRGKCLVLPGNDIDTDRIIPARFLKCVSFTNLGGQVFADDRSELKGAHPFDQKQNYGASILVVNDNFGCGSSREHAPQALMRWGIRALIGQSFAEIFYSNCLSLGIPCATGSEHLIKDLQKTIEADKSQVWELNLKHENIKSSENTFNLTLETGPLKMLLTGKWDATSQLISQKKNIEKTKKSIPYLSNFDITN